MKRLVLVLAATVLSVSACSSGSDGDSADGTSSSTPAPTSSSSTPAPAEASARSDVGGVQVWDLTGDPSDESFGIRDTRADYSADKARAVRFELDGGSIELDLADLTFYHPEGDVYAFLSRTAELPAKQLAATYRDLIEQLDVDAATADTLDADLAAAPKDKPGQVSVSYPDEIRLGDWTIALSAAISPAVGTGVVTVSAGYKPLPVG